MTAKIIRILLVFTTIMVCGIYLPDLYRKSFEKRSDKKLLYYSEVARDFVFSTEMYDTVNHETKMVYSDRQGNLLSENEYAALLPFDNVRKLTMLGLMPDSVMGEPLTKEILKTVRRIMIIGDKGFDYQINPMFESQPDRPGVELPDDLFRVNKRGVEFIDVATNRVNTQKSKLFNDALSAAGFAVPATEVYGIPSTIKSRDDGYFLVDNIGKLFHVIMIKGQPTVRAIDNDFEIKHIKCHVPGEMYCHIFTPDNELYVLTTDYKLIKLPIEENNGRFMLTYNCYFRSYKNMGRDSSTMYVLDSAFNLVDRCSIPINSYRNSRAAEVEAMIFPFRFMITPGYTHIIPIPNDVSKFFVINLVFMVLLIGIKAYNKRKLLNVFNIVDYLMVAVFGIYGFISVLIFPNRH